MTDAALNLAFRRMNETEQPVLFHSEFAPFQSAELDALLKAGIVRQTRDLEEILHSNGLWMAVRRTDDRLFGVSPDEDDYFDPVPLAEEDVRAYEIVMPNVIKLLRDNNGIVGADTRARTSPAYLGRKEIEAWGTLDVYLAWPNSSEREFATSCRELRPAEGINHVGLLTPIPIGITSELQAILATNSILPIPLSMHVVAPSLIVDWDVAIGARAPAISPNGKKDPLDQWVSRKFIMDHFVISGDTIRRYDGEGATPKGTPWTYITDTSDKRGRRLYHLREVFAALGKDKLKGELKKRGELGLAQVLDTGETEDNVYQVRSKPDGQMHR